MEFSKKKLVGNIQIEEFDLMFNLKKNTTAVLSISMFLVVLNCFVSSLGLYNNRTSPPLFVASLILTGLFIMLYIKNHSVIKLPCYVTIPIIFIGIAYGIAGVFYFVPTYIMLGYIFALQLPLLYTAIKDDYYGELIASYCKSYVVFSVLIFVACFISAPLTGEQYQGIFNNPNLMGEFLSALVVALLFLYENETKKNSKVLILILFGISVAFTLFTRSRTTMLAYALIAISYFIYIFIKRIDLKRCIVSYILAIVIFVPITFVILNNVTHSICEITGITITSESFVDDTENEKPANNNIKDELEATKNRLFKGLTDGNSFSSGRVQIWYTYLTNLTLKGHEPDRLIINYGGQELQANSHNAFLHVSYQSGIISGFAYVFIYCTVFVLAFNRVRKKNLSDEILFSMCILANSIPYIILSNTLGPYTSFSILAFWVIVVPFYSKRIMRTNIIGLKQFVNVVLGK